MEIQAVAPTGQTILPAPAKWLLRVLWIKL
jgi:hypothetical protein